MAVELNQQHDYSSWIVVATTIFLIWALLFAGLRTWAKTKRSLQWALYDNFFIFAFILSIGECVSIYVAVHYGFLKPTQSVTIDDYARMVKAAYASQILYIASIAISKVSTILFLRELIRDVVQKRICYAIIALVSCWTIAAVFTIALRDPLSAPWQILYDHDLYVRWLGVESAGLALELVMWAVAVTLCWSLNMPYTKRLRVASIFGFRLILIPLTIARLYFLSRAHNLSSHNAIAIAQVFTQGAMQYSLMAECMTCLKPFLSPFHTAFEYSLDDTAQRRRGLKPFSNNPRREAYTYVTTSNTSSKYPESKIPERTISQRLGLDPSDHAEEQSRMHSNNVSFRAQIGRDEVGMDRVLAEDRLAPHGSRGAIHQTTTVSVDHEDSI